VARAAASAGPSRSVPAATRPRRGRRPRVLGAVAGLAAAAAAVAIAVIVSGGSHPTQYQAALAGTAIAPAATAQVTLTQTVSGWRITLQGRGLPRLDDGYYYEAWLKNAAGILVPVGTFNQPNNVTLWAGVPPTQYPTITITRQQADGNPASSGQRVLVGVAHPAH
jgi:Anti-sigma-K factor rskA